MTRTPPTDASGGFLPYAQARKAVERHPIRSREVPVEHEVSLPVPTGRWGRAAYAVFAGPAHRQPGGPIQLHTPDRWWAIDARTGALLSYNQTASAPFADDLPGPVEIPATNRPVRAVVNDLGVLGDVFDRVVPWFFIPGEQVDAQLVSDLDELWSVLTPEQTRPWYRALAPDFFAWLSRELSQGASQ